MLRFFTYILLAVNALPCFAQEDIYNLQNSKIYGRHLLKNKNYSLAADEWKRVVEMEPSDTNTLVLLKTYRLAGRYDDAEKLSLSILPFFKQNNTGYIIASEEYFKTLLQSGKYKTARDHYSATYISLPKNASAYNFQAYFLDKKWIEAKAFYNQNLMDFQSVDQKKYTELIYRSENLIRRSPGLAAGLSTVVPGLGKVYANDWKDGVLALMMIGASTWQAYEGFSAKGTRSVYGWVYGGLAVGFYTGTIYGSYKSAVRFNKRQEQQLIEDAKQVFFSAY